MFLAEKKLGYSYSTSFAFNISFWRNARVRSGSPNYWPDILSYGGLGGQDILSNCHGAEGIVSTIEINTATQK